MPAIASLEDLKAAQKEGVSIYAMRYALRAVRWVSGIRSNRMSFNWVDNSAIRIRHAPEQLKGEEE